MGKITPNELSEPLNDFIDEKLNTEEYSLMTESKTIVGAINEIYGKEIIANAIGEPLDRSDTFAEMGNDINSLLSTFKTNMMNSGVMVESGDKFKQLIDKIKGLTEGEGNKGIQFAEGVCDNITIGVNTAINWTEYIFEQDFGFIPSRIMFQSESTKLFALKRDTRIVIDSHYHYSEDKCWYMTAYNSAQGLDNYRIYISNISSTGFSLFIKSDSSCFFNSNTWYAIGVGEEDNTLRDSLASILTDEGVNVTEEDDMASLINKVDSEFNAKESEITSKNNEVTDINLKLTNIARNNGDLTSTPDATLNAMVTTTYNSKNRLRTENMLEGKVGSTIVYSAENWDSNYVGTCVIFDVYAPFSGNCTLKFNINTSGYQAQNKNFVVEIYSLNGTLKSSVTTTYYNTNSSTLEEKTYSLTNIQYNDRIVVKSGRFLWQSGTSNATGGTAFGYMQIVR